MTQISSRLKGLIALTPLIVFMVSYLAVSLITGDFYKMPIAVAFLIASVYAIAITRNEPFNRRIEHFSNGAANQNVML
ncbi:MAG: Na+/H+ antiporter NhaC family protein, partial [Rikenellaceae bacterium]|nr:Na+/H+ antiporter NhaC family protein [Rikenellaceae bacterium]